MPVDIGAIRSRVRDFDFVGLFVEELGWDRHRARLDIPMDGTTFTLQAVAQKRGVVVYACDCGTALPPAGTLVKVEKQVTKATHEHLIVYTAGREAQLWQYAKREAGKPTYRTHRFFRGQSGEALAQRLAQLEVALEDEEQLTLPGVLGRMGALDVETRITRRFYERFQREHAVFLGFIRGIWEQADRKWYASLMLNRLMFVYFIQKKGFLAGDEHYLRNRLRRVQAERGTGHFLSFYRYFLLRLFHEGLGQQRAQRAPDLEALLGDVPYLNGGLFEVHQLEEANPDIEIEDTAFERIFAFFDEYQWHLDTRPLRDDREINPDVLGYIFEKYINQKEMGAYYTKEDITGYIAQSTIIPHVLERARGLCRIAFEPDGPVWTLLRQDPDRYLYEQVRKGVDVPLPTEIAAGLKDVSQRSGWNRPAEQGYALPTETWREHVARRTRCLELRGRLAAGEIHAVDDLVTHNLDLVQLAQDAIDHCEGPDVLSAFYRAIKQVTVLDPTCGSGAFLFAALNILKPLYDACLDRMQDFLDEWQRSGTRNHPNYEQSFARELQHAAKHPSRDYFILKSIIVNNLYGVDIMEEAVEICKLRLFLKLVAQVEQAPQLEPLPDVDFNVRAGNTLVGFTSRQEVDRSRRGVGGASQMKMDLGDAMTRIDERLAEVEGLARLFREQQTEFGGAVTAADKAELRAKLRELAEELDRYLAADYGIDQAHFPRQQEYERRFEDWRLTHQPFHWLAEFYGIMRRGGFDVIIGNPPYVEYRKVRGRYHVMGYATETCGNLYAYVLERCVALSPADGLVGMIVPLSAFATDRMAPLVGVLTSATRDLWVSNYGVRPSKLFEGVNWRLAVMLAARGRHGGTEVRSTKHRRWSSEERDTLFPLLTYCRVAPVPGLPGVPKYTDPIAATLIRKMQVYAPGGRAALLLQDRRTPYFINYQEATQYWVKALNRLPYYEKNGVEGAPVHSRFLYLEDAPIALALCAALNSSTFYVFFNIFSDCYHLSDQLVRQFPIPPPVLADPRLRRHGECLMEDLVARAKIEGIRTSRGDVIRYASLTYTDAKGIIDQIDAVLGEHYGFTDEELDFIQNYDVKYRMGQEAGDEG